MPHPIPILVVDDEPDLEWLVRQTFRKQIRQGDYDFAFARDGLEALDMLNARPGLALVLTDINMPRMDGLTLLDHIRQQDRLLRVVVVSAYGDLANIRTAMNRGAFDFVTKPINLDDLKTTIDKAWQDVQALREAEAARRALDRARQLETVKARFFADLSHEFRTPLMLLLGPLDDALATGVLPTADVPAMHRHARRLKRLIDQLLDLAKLDAGRLTLRAARHDLVPFLDDLVLAFAPAAERKGITLHFDAPDDTPLNLYFEPDKLEKIVANLLSNALKFTPEGGHIKVACWDEDAAVAVAVRDTGPGIPKEALPHLFDRFYQLDAPGAGLGTGIGLALTKELVELHGGAIIAESDEGFGTTFTLRLPKGRAHLPDDAVVEETEHDLAVSLVPPMPDDPQDEGDIDLPPDEAPTVLIIDDNADVRAYLRRRLGTRYRVEEAEDGIDGLEKVQSLRPDLVVSDVSMPGLDGFELCRRLKADPDLAPIPIILLTARAAEDDALEGLQTGADDFLTKPFNARELLLRAENLIEVRRMLRERFSDRVALGASGIDVPSADAVFLEQVQGYIEAHMGEARFDVASVAEAVGVSPRQLRRKIRDITGLSPSGLVRTLRLQRAAHLLERRAGGVAEVAYAVGFDDAKYFSQQFRQVYGVLPSEYTGPGGANGQNR